MYASISPSFDSLCSQGKAEATECAALERKVVALEKELKDLTRKAANKKMWKEKHAQDLEGNDKSKR